MPYLPQLDYNLLNTNGLTQRQGNALSLQRITNGILWGNYYSKPFVGNGQGFKPSIRCDSKFSDIGGIFCTVFVIPKETADAKDSYGMTKHKTKDSYGMTKNKFYFVGHGYNLNDLVSPKTIFCCVYFTFCKQRV